MNDGTGLKKLIPPIADSDYYQKNYLETVCIVNKGLDDTIMVNGIDYAYPMEAIPQIDSIDLTNIINYINNRWYPDLPYVSVKTVKSKLHMCK